MARRANQEWRENNPFVSLSGSSGSCVLFPRIGIPALRAGSVSLWGHPHEDVRSTPRPAPGSTVCHAGGLKAINSADTATLAVFLRACNLDHPIRGHYPRGSLAATGPALDVLTSLLPETRNAPKDQMSPLYSYLVGVGGTCGGACRAEGVGNRLTRLSFAGCGGEVRQMMRDTMTGKTGLEKSGEAVDRGGRMAY